ncbi:ABC-type nitrate/sulfonate/bicarbonate transport system substrate-binding protein [Actinoplanes campanulatus]|uniref:ABC-type nitrate/sulfonate/bicarbonate transport system substrate-binding protein n=1 Tax=Actinoplanes campanulatus TaxID=113559 RepID=A0A7W5AGN4_9ACTN|nr:ABC transporter substrate-binding protein [Actinoplanes campanulatus]MBB3095429.1 ABC-type nitrate/sulfonate/bicarbonate transport system substrate-binding protein [Actinoplanes campanulatus]GGN42025.1 ABC transporter substrate-binding protein [Actinoplanes campanulatus]GID35032.1 ABC transporter substrate-binding protein [Actinoplanes campanulatus]
MTTRRSALAAALAGVLAVTTLAACGGSGSAAAGDQVKELRYQGNVGAVTLAELAADLGYLSDVKLKWIGNTISGPQDIQAATTGDTDFGGAFNGAIVKLASSGAPITAVVGYYGVDDVNFNGFYVLDDSPIKSARDLIGKKIGVNTLGAHSEAITKTYLAKEGLTDEEIKQVELIVVPPVNTEQSLRAKQIDVAALGGTLRDKALERGGIHPLYTDYDLLGKFTAGSYIFRDDFIRKNPDTVKTFVAGVGKAIEWSRATPREEVIAKLQEIIKKRGREEDDSQTKFWKSYGVAGKGGVIEEREFRTWIEWLDRAGELKKDIKATDIYSNDYNSFATGGAA